jgi:hypothetical protein
MGTLVPSILSGTAMLVGDTQMRDIAVAIWIGCGCLFGLVVVVVGLVIATGSGGAGGAIAALALVGIAAYFVWTYRTNHYDSHGCRIEYLCTDRAYPRTHHRSRIGRDIPADVAARHPDHITD